jgi:hypothetical protein
LRSRESKNSPNGSENKARVKIRSLHDQLVDAEPALPAPHWRCQSFWLLNFTWARVFVVQLCGSSFRKVVPGDAGQKLDIAERIYNAHEYAVMQRSY